MGFFFSRPTPPPPQPIVIQSTSPGQAGQTTVIYGAQQPAYGYGYGYGYGSDLALVGDMIVADVVADVIVDDIMFDSFGGSKLKKNKKRQIKKNKK